MRMALFLVALAALGAPALAEDVLVLKDGHEVKGKVVSRTEKEIRILVGDGEYVFETDEIEEVRMGDRGETPPPEEKKPADDGVDVIRLREGGREFRGKIVAEDETTVTLKTENGALGFEKSVIEWIKKDGEIRRMATPEAKPRPTPTPEREPRPDRERPNRERREGRQPSPEMKRWIQACIAHLGSEDLGVRRSASSALLSIGRLAHPALEEAARGDDERIATMAKQLLERQPNRGNRERNPGRRGSQLERLAKELALTEEQKPKVKAIFEDLSRKRREMAQAMRSGEIPREDFRARWEEIQGATTEALRGVLTEEQMTRYEDYIRRRRGPGEGRRGR